ncbi:MAG: PQQ-binding-like beta-propeller repeat protein [Planctomycetota bacterium]
MSEQSVSPESESVSKRRFRWEIGAGIIGLGCLLELLVWFVIASDRTYQVFFSLPVVSGTVFFTFLWWVFASGLPWTTRGIGVVVLVLAVGAFRSQYRFVEFRGDMMPVFVHVSEPTAEERLDEYLDNLETAEPAAPAATTESGDTEGDEQASPRLEIADTDWPEFRGRNRDGVVAGDLSSVNWQQAPTEVWRHPVGKGWSSFSIVGGLAFTQEQRGDKESVVCYEASTGKQVWEHADDTRFDEAMGGPGPRATPTITNSRVYALGATGQLNCLDALTGSKLWSANILEDANAENIRWAMSGSPLVADGKVIVVAGGGSDRGVIAYDAESGKQVWSAGSAPASYAAPLLAELEGTQTILAFHGTGLSGHALSDGQLLWTVPWENEPKVNAAEPIVVDDRNVLISSGYAQGAAMIRLQQDGDAWKADTAWTEKRFKLKFNAAVRKGSYAYGLSEGILMCLNLDDGSIEWKRGRYGYGQLLLAGDVLIIQAETGEVAIVAAQPERYDELAVHPALDAKTWNHPVVWNGHLFVRNGEEAACFALAQ